MPDGTPSLTEKSFNLYIGERYAELAEYLDHIDKRLEDVFPDEEKSITGKWRRLLTFYRHVHVHLVMLRELLPSWLVEITPPACRHRLPRPILQGDRTVPSPRSKLDPDQILDVLRWGD